jgi:hypothetical protein
MSGLRRHETLLAGVILFGAQRYGANAMDLSVTYTWNPGALPPPHYYEIRIILDDGGDGVLEARPDHAFNDPPTWRWPFRISQEEATRLLQDIARQARDEKAALAKSLGGSPEIGGGQESLTLSDGAATREVIPAEVVGVRLRSTVPQRIWEEFEERRSDYASAR